MIHWGWGWANLAADGDFERLFRLSLKHVRWLYTCSTLIFRLLYTPKFLRFKLVLFVLTFSSHPLPYTTKQFQRSSGTFRQCFLFILFKKTQVFKFLIGLIFESFSTKLGQKKQYWIGKWE